MSFTAQQMMQLAKEGRLRFEFRTAYQRAFELDLNPVQSKEFVAAWILQSNFTIEDIMNISDTTNNTDAYQQVAQAARYLARESGK